MEHNCIFCKIIKGEIPSQKVFSTETVYAFRDLHPAAPAHILVIPKKHIASMDQAQPEDSEVMGSLMLAAAEIARQENLDTKGYRLVINTNEWGGQTVSHIHVHILGGRQMLWPPG